MIEENLSAIRKAVETLAVEHSQKVPQILAVSKLKPKELLLRAFEAGQIDFGENYVQELSDKSKQLPQGIQWHFIGHLQSNKCKTLLNVPNLKRISSVDSIALANKLESVCKEINRTIEVLIQVKSTHEETKSGTSIEEAIALTHHITQSCPHLFFKGFMTVGHVTDTNITAKCFQDLVTLRAIVCEQIQTQWGKTLPKASTKNVDTRASMKVDEKKRGQVTGDSEQILDSSFWDRVPKSSDDYVLSMGMSGDLELAIQNGSSEVRIGTAIFGERPLKH